MLQVQCAALPSPILSPVPRIVLTECVSVPLSSTEDSVRDLTRDQQVPPKAGRSQEKTSPQTVSQIQEVTKRQDPIGQAQRKPPRRELRIQESFEMEGEETEKLAVVLTELEVMVVSPSEAQELRRTGAEGLQTLTLPPLASEGNTEVRLCGGPLLVLFRETVTVQEAYRQLHSLLGRDGGSSKPVPKPRAGPSHSSLCRSPRIILSPDRRDPLREALRVGMETGDKILTLHSSTGTESAPAAHPELGLSSVDPAPKPNGSAGSEEGQARVAQSPWTRGEDIRSSTYRRLDSLEETIRELENTLLELSGHPPTGHFYPETLSTDTRLAEVPEPARTPSASASETKKPPVPPKPCSFTPTMTKVHNLLRHIDSHSWRACSHLSLFFSPLLWALCVGVSLSTEAL